MVVAYDSGTKRSREMLTVLEAIMPYFLNSIVGDKKSDVKDLRETIHQLSLTMKTLISNCEKLTA